MKEVQKTFYKKTITWILGSIVLFVVISAVYELWKGHDLVDHIKLYTVKDHRTEDLRWKVLGEDILTIEDMWVEDEKLFYRAKGHKAGSAFLAVYDTASGDFLTSEEFAVSFLRVVTEKSTGDYSNCRFHLFISSLLLTVIIILLLFQLIRYSKVLRYSYEMMFVGGLLIWLICTAISQWYAYLNFQGVYYYYQALKEAGYRFILYTAPIILCFCIAMSISNVSLLRHERIRVTNMLGFLISAMLFWGSILAIAVANIEFGGSKERQHIINILISIFTTAYSIFAALLEGAILGGIFAAKHKPSLDCDYVIILGCMIRKDGSLTPLLRGRVDRAIAYAKQRHETTGQEVIFVPSGGQGPDEVMAEADAMQEYLLSQGVPKERILAENKSKNTMENMAFSRKLICEKAPDAKIAFSTTNYHVFRSGIIATQNGFVPEGMGSKTRWYFWPNAFIREYIGMMSYTKKAIVVLFLILTASFAGIEIFL